MNKTLAPTPQQYLELHDMAMDTLWQAELVASSLIGASLQDDELEMALRAILTILQASKLYDLQGIGELRSALKSEVAA